MKLGRWTILCSVLVSCFCMGGGVVLAAEPIAVGAIASLTGYLSDQAQNVVEGMELGVEEINAKGGVLGRQLKLYARDDEMKPRHFIELWSRRKDFDALIGIRQDRRQPFLRRLTTMGSRLAVYLFFGKAVTDVNVPYRLIRASCLELVIRQIPDNTFSPNILISGALSRSSLRIYNHRIPCEGRKTGSPSLMRWKLIRSILISFLQILRFRLALKRKEFP